MSQKKEADWRPSDRLAELLQNLRNLQTTIHTGEEEGYEYLEGGSVCIEADNPSGGDPLFIDLEDGFTVTLGEWEAYYEADEEDWKLLTEELNRLLQNEMYTVVVYCRDAWICSMTIEEAEISAGTVKKQLKEFLHSADCDSFISLIREKGAGVRCAFWTGGKKNVRLRPGELK